jgi:hypothetical protein
MSRRIGSIAALAAALLLAVPVVASHVQPEFTRDAESCGTLTPGTVELLVDASDLGTAIPSQGQFRVDVLLTSGGPDGESVSFSGATLPVEAAFVAGTDGGNFYDYPDPVRADEGLVAPNGQPIVNVSFCYIVAERDSDATPTGGVAGATGENGGAGDTAPPTDTAAEVAGPGSPAPVIAVGVLLIGLAVGVATIARLEQKASRRTRP